MERFWIRWLYGAAGLTVVAGLFIAAFTGTALLAPLEDPIRAVFWAGGRMDASGAAFSRFVFGVAGAIMASWGLTVLLLVRFALADGQRWAWWTIAAAIDLWYVVDTSISAYYGVWINVVMNTFFLVLYAVPLLAIRRRFVASARRRSATMTAA
jgi:hypothetical protein